MWDKQPPWGISIKLRPKSGRLSPVLFPNGLMNIESPVYEVSTE